MFKTLPILAMLALVFTCNSLRAQLYEIPLTQKIQGSAIIIEGKVLNSTSYWDIGHSNIYTVHEIQTAKVFKGGLDAIYHVVTLGGTVGLQMQQTTYSLKLRTGDYGIFTLIACDKNLPVSDVLYEAYADLQGFLKFDKHEESAATVFAKYNDIQSDLRSVISLETGKALSLMNIPWKKSDMVIAGAKATPTISSFFPTTTEAGTHQTLTINGTNFGGTIGTVSFANSDDGGATFVDALDAHIVSWADTEIQIHVPSDAGTGNIRVENATAETVTSGGTLTINYAHINAESDAVNPGTFVAYETQHIDEDGNGGYTWQMFTDFNNNASANASFVRAMDTWRCTGTNINWSIGSTTTTNVIADDGVNVIRFDIGGELPVGVLGRCTSRFSGCFNGPTDLDWFVEELDIVFDDGQTWNFGPGAPGPTEYDFETVAVHELGHGHQLTHVINTNEIMHYAVSNGEQNIVLSANDLAGGNFVMGKSTTAAVCGQSLMTNYSCGSAPVAAFTADQTTVCQGTGINFTDQSTNTPTSWSWNFGDGSPVNTNQNPNYTYPTAGTYTVTLTATNASGSDNEVKTSYITINDVAGNAGAVTGSTSECENSTGVAYSISAVANATGYTWTVPSGANIVSGQGTVSITVDFGTTSGNVEVTPTGPCGNGASNNTAVTINSCVTTELKIGHCGITATDLSDVLRCNPVAGAYYYKFRFRDPGLGTDKVVTGTSPYCFPEDAYLSYGTTYEVYVDWATYGVVYQGEGAMCNFTTPSLPTTSLTASHCGSTSSDLTSPIWCDEVPGALRYRFRFRNPGTGTDHYVTNTSRFIYPDDAVLDYNTVYDVYVNWQDGDLNWQTEGAMCNFTTPSVVTTQVKPIHCGTTLASMWTIIVADHVPAAIRYRFRFHDPISLTDRYYTSVGRTTTAKKSWLELNTVYEVYVAWQNGSGDWQPEGSVCQITTPITLSKPIDVLVEANEGKSIDQPGLEFSLVAFPNPTRDDLQVQWTGSSDVVITLVDLTGKVLYQEMLSNTNSKTLNLESHSSGMYILLVTAGETSQVLQILKE